MTRPASMRPMTGIGSRPQARAERLDRAAGTAATAATPAPRSAAATPAARRCRSGFWSRRSRPRRRRRAHPTAAAQTLCERLDLRRRPGQQPQRRQPLGEPIGIGVEPQHRLERREADLVEAKCALERVPRKRAIRSARPTTSPACGPPSSLSPLNVTRSAPAFSASATVGSCGRSPALEIDQGAAAEILDKRAVVLVRQLGELRRRHCGGEALDLRNCWYGP